MAKLQNEEAKTNKNMVVIDEEELESILEKIYDESHEWDLDDEEKMEKFLEEEFEKYRNVKWTRRLKLLQELDPFGDDEFDAEAFLDVK